MKNAARSFSDSNRLDLLRALCVRYAELVARSGIRVVPYDPSAPSRFATMLPEVQDRAIHAVAQDIAILEAMYGAGEDPRDSTKHLWRFLQRMNLTPQSDLFDKIERGDTVEVYFLEPDGQRQMFRNLRFLECVSFTLEQIYGIDWKLATTHDSGYADEIMGAIQTLMSAPHPQTIGMSGKPHTLHEVDSPGLYSFSIQLKYFSPLIVQGQLRAIISINRSTVLSSAK